MIPPISAAEAQSAGLIAEVLEAGTVVENVLETASTLAVMAVLSHMVLSLAKEMICRCRYSAVLTKAFNVS